MPKLTPRERIVLAATAMLADGNLREVKTKPLFSLGHVARVTFYRTFSDGLDEAIRAAFEDAADRCRYAAHAREPGWPERNREALGTVLLAGPQIDLARFYEWVDQLTTELKVPIAALSGALHVAAKRLREDEPLDRGTVESIADFLSHYPKGTPKCQQENR